MPDGEITLRHLKVLSLLLEVGSLTRAGDILGISQPTMSKMLARLRGHFGDPLLVRVGLTMHPTPKAQRLIQPLAQLLATSDQLRASTRAFDPATSDREFTILATEVGMIQLVPPIMQHLERAGHRLRLRALPLDSRPFEVRLEAGEADLALGAFAETGQTLRRQHLYSDSYSSVVRRDHPRRASAATPAGFWQERHVVVTASATGHAAHRRLEQILATHLPADLVLVSVPSFLIGAFVASRTDAVATVPSHLAIFLENDLRLARFPPPTAMPPIEIDQFWSDRVHQDEGHQWFRASVHRLFGGGNLNFPADPVL